MKVNLVSFTTCYTLHWKEERDMSIKRKTRNFLKGKELILSNLAMLATVIFWGVSFISTKIILRELPPSTIALIRFTLASFILALLMYKVEPDLKRGKADLPWMALGGLLGITFYYFFENNGINLTTAVNASLIVTFVPLVTICLDIVFFHSKASALKITGVAIALVGTYLSVTANGQISFSSTHFKGNLFMVGAMLVWAFYTLVNKFLQRKHSGLYLTTLQTVFGTVFLIPLALLEVKEWKMFSWLSFLHILFLAVCCSVLGYLFYIYALKHLDVAVTTIYLNLIPVVGAASGFIFLNESVLPIQLAGGLLTFLAIIVVNYEVNHKPRFEPAKKMDV